MSAARVKTLTGETVEVSAETVEQLRTTLRGEAVVERDGHHAARSIWNGMVDRRAGLVIRALGASDVRHAVNLAREHNLLISIRSGGHQIAGHSVAEGALLLDLSQMKPVHVDPQTRRARVEPGAMLGDVDSDERGLRRQHDAAGRDQAQVRPRQLVPDELQHPTAVASAAAE